MPVVEGVVSRPGFLGGGASGRAFHAGIHQRGVGDLCVCEMKYRYLRDHLGGSSVRQKAVRGECAAELPWVLREWFRSCCSWACDCDFVSF